MKTLVALVLAAVAIGVLSVSLAQQPAPNTPAAAKFPQRWNSVGGDFTTDEGTTKFIALMKQSKTDGCTHILVGDGRFFRDDMKPAYFQNIAKVKAAAKEMNLALVPSVYHIGYGSHYFGPDGNIAAGLPVKNMVFVVKDGKANPDMAQALDASKMAIDGGNLAGSFAVKPFTSYRISFLTTGPAAAGEDREDVLHVTSAKRWHNRTNPTFTKQGDKLLVQTIFNTLDAEKITVTIKGGDKVSDVKIVPAGSLLIVRRKLVPLTVTSEDGKTTYEEGKDFKPLFDPIVNVKPFPGEFPLDHEAVPIELTADSKIKDGQKLLVSFWHTQRIYNDQDTCSMEDPVVFDLMERDIKNGVKAWGEDVDGWFLGYDEIRLGGWEPQPDGKDRTPGQELAEHFKKGYDLVKKYSPKAQIYTWSDMFTPFHNAGKGKDPSKNENYYLVKGNWYGSWELLPKDVIILNWHAPKPEGITFFSDKGHKQVLCGFYDATATADMKKNIDHWMTVSKGAPGILGFMYTTFGNNYKSMDEYFKLVDTYAEWGQQKTADMKDR
jgi:hypothetical protein